MINKKPIVIACVTLAIVVGLLILLAFVFSSKGTLKLNIDPSGTTVTIDKNTYKAGYSFSKNLEEGAHIVTVDKNGYELFSENIKITKKQTVSKNIKLGLVSDILKEKGTAFVEALNNITPSTNPGTYQQSLKEFSTASLYGDLRRRYAVRAPASRPANHLQDYSKIKINNTNVLENQPTEGTIELDTTLAGKMGESNFSYKIAYTLTFIKSGDKWLLSSMKAD